VEHPPPARSKGRARGGRGQSSLKLEAFWLLNIPHNNGAGTGMADMAAARPITNLV